MKLSQPRWQHFRLGLLDPDMIPIQHSTSDLDYEIDTDSDR